MQSFMSDLRHGLRLLRRYPATSVLAVITLGLGIGANTAIFSVVDSVILRRLPYPEPDRLVMVWEKRPTENVLTNVVSPADFLDWKQRQTPLEQIAAFAGTQVTLTGQGEPMRLGTGVVTAGFFDALGMRAALGRTFQPGDDGFPQQRLAIITHGLWQRAFGRDPAAVGKTMTVNGNAWEIVGVLPSTFRFSDPSVEIWVPLVLEGSSTPPTRVSHQFTVYARRRPGVTLGQARDAMDRLGKEIEAEHPQENRGHGAWVTSLRDEFVGPVQTQLAVIFAAVAIVLLIACVNVANLLLARAATRRREMAVRAALGAGRRQLVTQGVAEALAVAVAGGVLGLGLALLLLQALPLILPPQMSVVEIAALQLDTRVLLFAIGLSLLTGLIVGLLPALSASRPELVDAMKEGGRGAAGVRRGARRALVIAEVALAALALVGGGLVLRSFSAIVSQPLGFDSAQRLTLTLAIPGVGYPTPEHRKQALADIEQRLSAIPGVAAVGAINLLPLAGGDSRIGMGFESRERVEGEPPTRMHPRIVTPGYFGAIGIPIVKGRNFTPDDHATAEPVVIVSEASVRRFWPGVDPIGQRVRFGGNEIVWRRIIGIAGDVKHWGLTREVNPVIYWPQAQAGSTFLTFVLKSHVEPTSLTTAVRAQVAAVDPKLPIGDLRTLDRVVSNSMRSERAQTILMAAFGLLGLLLAVIGIYGVMAQLVTVRVPEIGVRMTLGARPFDILRQLLTEGLWQTAAGLVIGLGAGVYLMKFATALLFNVQPWDPATLTIVAVILLAAALAACFVPARRAMRVDPVQALRDS
jgi:predicted permease